MKDAGRYTDAGPEDLTAKVTYGLMQMSNVVANMSFVSNKSDLLRMVTEGRPEAMQRWAGRTGSVIVPNAVKQVDLLFDRNLKESDGLRIFYSQIPFARQGLKDNINVFGQQIKWNPNILWSDRTDDPVFDFLVEKQIWISKPGKTNKIGDRTMTPEELYELTAISGPRIDDRVGRYVNAWANLDDQSAEKLVRKIVDQERDAARRQIARDPRFR